MRHVGDKPFICPICTNGFPSQGGLNSHMKVHKKSKNLTKVLFKLNDINKQEKEIQQGSANGVENMNEKNESEPFDGVKIKSETRMMKEESETSNDDRNVASKK